MDFNTLVDDRYDAIKKTLVAKAKEYATDGDRFHNFNIAGQILGVSPERALLGMLVKHIVSVFDLVEWAENDLDKLNHFIVDEKITDSVNYLILLEGLLTKRINDRNLNGRTA